MNEDFEVLIIKLLPFLPDLLTCSKNIKLNFKYTINHVWNKSLFFFFKCNFVILNKSHTARGE